MGYYNRNGSETGNHSVRALHFTPKLEFPKFNGTSTRTWIKKCGKYFELCKIPDDQKVDIASLHMTDKAEGWVTSYLSGRRFVSWDEFIVDVTGRFRDESGVNIVEQFNKLQQQDNLETYVDEFENLRSIMLQSNHVLPEGYILDSFIGGLKPALKPFVKAFKPSSITEAIDYARLQEESLQLSKPGKQFSNNQTKTWSTPLLANTKPPLLPTPSTSQSATSNNVSAVPQKVQNSGRNNTYIPANIRAEKMAKGLCYFCDQRYEKGHKCKFREAQLFTVEVPGSEVSECDMEEAELQLEPCISVNALAGNHTYQTMRVRGLVNGKPLHILVDSGSTHNFLDEELASTLNIEVKKISPQSIAVADGNSISCT